MPSVSESFRRKEGPEKLTGVAKYIDDYPLPGCIHGVTLRSTIARGVIKNIHFDPAFDWGPVTVVSAKDIPGQNYVYLLEVDQPLLAEHQIRHAQEPILVIGHTDRAKAYEALAHIHVEYDEWDPVATMEESLDAKRLLYAADNVFKRIEIVKGDLDAGFALADFIVEEEYRVPHQEQAYIENNGRWRPGKKMTAPSPSWARCSAPSMCTRRCRCYFRESPKKFESSRRRRAAALAARKNIRT